MQDVHVPTLKSWQTSKIKIPATPKYQKYYSEIEKYYYQQDH